MIDPKIDNTAAVVLEMVRDAAPAVLTMTEVSKKVAENADVSTSVARSRVRAAIETGDLLELVPLPLPDLFRVVLPGEREAGVGPFWIICEYPDRVERHVISTDKTAPRPSRYGPGRTTYVADPEQIREYVQKTADEEKAKKEAERQAILDEKKIERAEISRRFPDLMQSLHTLHLLGTQINELGGRFIDMDPRAYLRDSKWDRPEVAVEERDANVKISAWGDENVAILRSILKAGIAAYIAEQPVVHCKHCSDRILRRAYDGGEYWWHVETRNASCGQDRDTKAEPAEEEPKQGYIYAVAPYGDPKRHGWFPALCLGEYDYATYYTELVGEDEDSDPETWLGQWIEWNGLRPAEGYQEGDDGPFETSGHLREDTAHRTCWLWPWSDQLRAMRIAAIPPSSKEN